MGFWTLVLRSLRFHARAHLGVLLGSVIGSAALVGALIVGDSVRGTLREIALSRLGHTELALIGGDRFFRDALADELAGRSVPVAPLLQLSGTITSEDGSARANRVQVNGIDDRIKRVEPSALSIHSESGVVLNTALASQLKVSPGDSVLLRVQKPSALSREAPISPQQDYSLALRLKVESIAGDDRFGRFDLKASQLPPLNAFVPLRLLQEKLELTNRANLLLVGRGTTVAQAEQGLHSSWRPEDAELEVRLSNGVAELRSRRVFIDSPVANGLRSLTTNTGILTYFVNELRTRDKSTPYSMVTGGESPLVPSEMRDDEIMVNRWLADDLQAKPGDMIQLRYFVLPSSGTSQAVKGEQQSSGRLEERTNSFRVRDVVPMQGAYADRSLMPDFPGLAKAESTENWDAGFPIQMSKIRPKDEKYWKDFRGTPKAFVTLAAAQGMWSNRFGAFTAIRFPESVVPKVASLADPSKLGLTFHPVREQALKASSEAQDFGQLFLGFSFFLIVAGLILMGLLFQFQLEQRAPEVGTLLAVGFRPSQVRRLLLVEVAIIALIGGFLGMLLGSLYARAMLLGLTTIWSKAVAGAGLKFHVQPSSLAIGFMSSVVVALITVAIVLRRQARRPARELLMEGVGAETIEPPRRSRRAGMVAIASMLIALALIAAAVIRRDTANPGIFFGAGGLLLVGGIAAASVFLSKLGSSGAAEHLSIAAMGVRASTRRRKRSLATIGLLACGCFMIVAVGANRLEADRNAFERSSGTGGFALIGESSLPVFQDVNSEQGRDFFGLNSADLKDVSVVPFRLREGDDASCLNLNRAQTPRLLGVNPQLLHERFSFSDTASRNSGSSWDLLDQSQSDGTVPAIGDANSIKWALGKKIGDTLEYVDERGERFKVKLVGAVANSVLQGNVIISERNFVHRFPGVGGYRMFLIDAPSNTVAQTASVLMRGLQDAGLELVPAVQRLDAFNAVQNTYLSTFQVLGGLGLLVGSAGLGVVVLRNVLERRGELALLQAVGFRRRSIRWLVLSEHAGLLALGLAVGLIAALVSVIPTLSGSAARLPLISLSLTIGSVLVVGFCSTVLSVGIALRGRLLDALRNE